MAHVRHISAPSVRSTSNMHPNQIPPRRPRLNANLRPYMNNITSAQRDLLRPRHLPLPTILRRKPPRSRHIGRCRVNPRGNPRGAPPQGQVVQVRVIERDPVTGGGGGGLMQDCDPVVTLQRLGPPSREGEQGTGSFRYAPFDKGVDAREAEAEDGDWAFDAYPFAVGDDVIWSVQ